MVASDEVLAIVVCESLFDVTEEVASRTAELVDANRQLTESVTRVEHYAEQIAQLTAITQQLQAENQMLKMERETEILKIQSENERNDLNNQTKLIVEAMKQDFAKQQTLFQAELASIQQRLNMMHESEFHAGQEEQAAPQMNNPTPGVA